MMERTDRHCRYLLRLISSRALLYTEMITAKALLRGDSERLLRFDPREHPVAAQLGGANPEELAAAARLAEAGGYDEINLNVGCPSSRVQAGAFGAALMLEAQVVADCVAAMREAVGVPVTVKTRLGVDDHDDYDFLARFTAAVAAAGCGTVIVHARKAWLSGLSPKQNREVPPLDYARVYRLKRDFPEMEVVINGGFTAVDDAVGQLECADGVMLGRSAYSNPMLLAALEQRIYATSETVSRSQVLAEFIDYARREVAEGTSLKALVRHLNGLFAKRPGGKLWRQELSSLPDGTLGLNTLASLEKKMYPYSRSSYNDAVPF